MSGPDPADAPLVIRLFGPFDVQIDGQPLAPLRSRRGLYLLALLTLRHDREVQRDWLAGTLWPDNAQEQALYNLRRNLSHLRQALGRQADRLRSPTPRTLLLALSGAFCDVVAFEEALARGGPPSLHEAVGLYRGPLLEDCLEEWVLPERQAREQAYLKALETLAAQARERGDPAEAARHLRLLAEADPLAERAHCSLMEALAAGGDYAAVTLVFRALRLRLRSELNSEPATETTALYQRLRQEARRRAGRTEQETKEPVRVPPSLPVLLPSEPPTGTVTFLFADVEHSAQLWERYPDSMQAILDHYGSLLRRTIAAQDGYLFKTVGDAFCAAFATAPDALAAALATQTAFTHHREHRGQDATREEGQSPSSDPSVSSVVDIRVRMALHTGTVDAREGDYRGPPLNRVARLKETGHGGQILLSQTACDLARDHLPEDAGLRDLGLHRLKDLQQPERIHQLLHPSLPAEFAPLRSLSALPNNLPPQWTTFIGREREMEEVRERLHKTRLLTLTGTGGCGKTRLALQVAADVLEEYPDGVWLVELAALSDPGLVSQAAASALGVREEAGRMLIQTLTDHLRAKSLLLLLDNCEHLVEACAQLSAALLQGCPNLRILATSREPLNIRGEAAWRVPSLLMPDFERLPVEEKDVAAAFSEYDAVRLFVERALSQRPGFALTRQNASTVASVCHRLDGIPLAIELAAARAQMLSVEQIAARLDDRFRLLTRGVRGALSRHQTLRAALDWSYDLLTEQERLLLGRLSVFAGGWTLEAAEQVCVGEEIEEWEVLDLLTSLVDKSLVIAEEGLGGEARYLLLETIRQYGWERLAETGDGEGLRRRHLDFFLALAAEADKHLNGSEQAGWLERLETEHDNLRSALQWCKEEQDGAEVGLRLAGSLCRFWSVRGHLSEGREHLVEALAQEGAAERTQARALALHSVGSLARVQGDYPAAYGAHQESLAIWRESGNRSGIASALYHQGFLASDQGDYTAARTLYEESLAIWRELGDKRGIASLLNNMGLIAMDQGDYEAARALHEESLALRREIGDKRGVAWSLNNLGVVAYRRSDYAAARALYEESLALRHELKDRPGIVYALTNLGGICCQQGDCTTARALFEEGLAIARELGDRQGIAYLLHDLGKVQEAQGDRAVARVLYKESLAIFQELKNKSLIATALESLAFLDPAAARSVRLLGAAEALREALGAPLPPNDREEYDRHVAAAHTALGEEAFAAAWAEGRKMTMEQAITYALEEAEESEARQQPPFPDAGRMEARAKALCGAGRLAWMQGDYAQARAFHEESLSICREISNQAGIAGSLNNLGLVAHDQGDYAAARAYQEESLAISRESRDKRDIAASLNNLGRIAGEQGDYAAARALFEESLAMFRELGDKRTIAASLNNLAFVAHKQGNHVSARSLSEESLAIRRELGDKPGIALLLNNLGRVVQDQGDQALARALLEESLSIKRELGDKRGIASSLYNLGIMAYRQSDHASAQAYQEESLSIKREIGDRGGIAASLGSLGNVAYQQGDLAQARAYYAESLAIEREIGNRLGVTELLEAFASLAASGDEGAQIERAAHLWGVAERLREEVGAPLPPKGKEEQEQVIAAAQALLGEAAFAAAWEAGQQMTMEQAVAYALKDKSDLRC